jgi:hypothetical protein
VTVRVALAVLLAVALVAAAAPGMQAARERASAEAVETDAAALAAVIATVADAPTGTRRVVTVTVPGSTVGTAGVATVTVRSRSVRYRLDRGGRGAVALPAAVEPIPASDGSESAERLRLEATGAHELVVIATSDGVRVTRAATLPKSSLAGSQLTARPDNPMAGRSRESLSPVGRPASACSIAARTVGA